MSQKPRTKPNAPRNPFARLLVGAQYRRRVEAKKTGMGSYKRSNNRRPDNRLDGDSFFDLGIVY